MLYIFLVARTWGKYPLDPLDKGLFVIMEQLSHHLNFRETDFSIKKILNYAADRKKLLEIFDPQKQKPDNVLVKQDLTTKTFNSFKEKIKNKKDKINPSFIMLFLMSHGFENGEFLLAVKRNKNEEPAGPCCGEGKSEDGHTLSGDCLGRHIITDVVKRVCEYYPDKPKIFVIQTCRGKESDATLSGKADSRLTSSRTKTKRSDEIFIPAECPHTLVLHACVEQTASWVLPNYSDHTEPSNKGNCNLPEGGSLLIQNFCKSLVELKNSKEQYNLLVEEVQRKEMSAEQTLQEYRENITGGWILNICQRTTALVTNCLLVKLVLPYTALGTLLRNDEINQELVQKFEDTLKRHENYSKYPPAVRYIKTASERHGGVNRVPILEYLWYNVRRLTPSGKLNVSKISDIDKANLQEKLDVILEELKAPFELIEELMSRKEEPEENRNEITEKEKHELRDEFESCLQAYRRSTLDVNAAIRVIEESKVNKPNNGFQMLLYLQQTYHLTADDKPVLQITDMKEARRLNLQRDLDKILAEIKSPFGPLKELVTREKRFDLTAEEELEQIKEFATCLKFYQNVSLSPNTVQVVIEHYEGSQPKNQLCVLRYLQQRYNSERNADDKQVLEISDMEEEQRSRLQACLDEMVAELQGHGDYSKQQPHICSTLSKFLSCIDIMESQDKYLKQCKKLRKLTQMKKTVKHKIRKAKQKLADLHEKS